MMVRKLLAGCAQYGKITMALALAGGLAACTPTTTSGPAVTSSQPVKVALLLPYGSEKNGDTVVAQALENAARLALSDLSGVQVDLTVYNTAGSPTTGAAVAQQAADAGAHVILGPLYADVAAAVGGTVANDNLNVLAFSNNASIAGGNVFLLGNTFENTARRVLGVARNQGTSSVVVVHSNDVAGTTARAAIESAAVSQGITVTDRISYELSQNGVVQVVPTIRDAVRNSGADGLFLTSGTSGALPLFAQLLPEAGLKTDEVQYMGLARWDIPKEALAFPGLQGGLFALPDPALAGQFDSRYVAAYGTAPHPLAGLAYDGMAAIGAIRKSGSARIGAGELTSPSGFAGVNGVFRFLGSGGNQRSLAVAKIVDGQVQVISPAPRSFGGAGS